NLIVCQDVGHNRAKATAANHRCALDIHITPYEKRRVYRR
ncbi:MAG: hypothetical protein ACI81F_002601, partial [Thalassolituus oleivorans]